MNRGLLFKPEFPLRSNISKAFNNCRKKNVLPRWFFFFACFLSYFRPTENKLYMEYFMELTKLCNKMTLCLITVVQQQYAYQSLGGFFFKLQNCKCMPCGISGHHKEIKAKERMVVLDYQCSKALILLACYEISPCLQIKFSLNTMTA